uniref:GST C-terminal domain-containing protein n=1 Tax=Cucumis melo TaxID=3656 RepID=A0A9I9CCT7_CUCME
MKTEGEAQEKAIEDVKEKLKVLEEQGLKDLLAEGSTFVNGDELGYLDIVMLTVLGMYKVFEGLFLLMKTEGEAQEKAIEDVKEKLKVLEEQGLKDLLAEGSTFVNGDELGYLDIVMLTVLGMYKVHEEFFGVKIVEEEKIPVVFSWLNRLIEHPLAKEVAPPKEKVL